MGSPNANLAELRLFGSPMVVGGENITMLGRRARGLLGYLALSNPQRATRERLTGLFWPDRGPTQARASLRQCLVEVRAAIGNSLVADREWVALQPDVLTGDWRQIDVALAADDPIALAAALTEIGAEPLLDGLEFGEAFDDWLRRCRAALDARLGAAVLRHIELARSADDSVTALALADSWLLRDPRDEAVASLAIATEIGRGATAAARKRYRAFEDRLARDGDGPPSAALRAALNTSPTSPISPGSTAVQIASGTEFTLPTKPSVAVLPFVSLTDGNQHDAFADGMVEEISTVLSHFSSLFVIAGLSSLSYRGTTKTVQQIARELGVRYLLEGSVRRADGRVRIAVKLVDAMIGEQLWAERFDDTLEDVFDLQDRVANAVASTIDSTMTSAEMRRSVFRPTNSPDAYELSLCANAKLTRYDRDSVTEALGYAERAILLDPNYAWAVATAGFCHATLALNSWTADIEGSRRAARVLAERAMKIAGDDVMAITVTAGVLCTLPGDSVDASQLIERAMALNPQKAFVLFWGGVIDAECGSFARGLDRIEQAARLDPRSMYRPWHLMTMGLCLLGLHRSAEAALVLGEAVRVLPNYPTCYLALAASHSLMKHDDEARAALVRLDEMGGINSARSYVRNPAMLHLLDQAITRLGVPAEAA